MNPVTLIAAMLLSAYLRQSKSPLFSSGIDWGGTLEIRSTSLGDTLMLTKYEKQELCVDIDLNANPAPTGFTLTKDQTPVSDDAYNTNFTAGESPQGNLILRIPELNRGMSGQYSFTIENGIGDGVEFSFTLFVERVIFQLRIPEAGVPTFKNGSGTVSKIDVPIQAEPAPTGQKLIKNGNVQDKGAYGINYVSESPPDGMYTLTSLAFGHFELVIFNGLGDELRYKFEVTQKAPCYFSPAFYVGDQQQPDRYDFFFDDDVPEVTIFCMFVDVCQGESLLLKCPESQIEMTKEGRVIVTLTLTPAMHETRCTCRSNKPEVTNDAIFNMIFRSDLKITSDAENEYTKYETTDLELTIDLYGNPPPTIYVLTLDTIQQPGDAYVANYIEDEFPKGQVTFKLLDISLNMAGHYKLTLENSVGSQISHDINLLVSQIILRLQPGVPESQEVRNRSGSIPTVDVPLEVDPHPFSYQLFKDGTMDVIDTAVIDVIIPEETLHETVKLSLLDFGQYELVVMNELGNELRYSFQVVDKDPCHFSTSMSFDQQEMSQGHVWIFDSEQTVGVNCSFVEADLCQDNEIILQCPEEDFHHTGIGNVFVNKTVVAQMHEKKCICKSVKLEVIYGTSVTFDFKAGISALSLKNNDIFTVYATGDFNVDIEVYGNPPPTTYTLLEGEDLIPPNVYTTHYQAESFPGGMVTLHMPGLTLDKTGEHTFTINNGIGDGIVFNFLLVVKEAILVPRHEATEVRDYRNRSGVYLTIDVPVQAEPIPTIFRLVKNGNEDIEVNSHQVRHTMQETPNMTLHFTPNEKLEPDLYELEIENSVGDVIKYTFEVSDRDPCFYNSVISIDEEGPSKNITWAYSDVDRHKVHCRFQDVCRNEIISLECHMLKTRNESVTMEVVPGLSMHMSRCICKSIKPRTCTAEITFIYETAIVLEGFKDNQTFTLFEGRILSIDIGMRGNPIPNEYALTKNNITLIDRGYIVAFKPGQFPNGIVVFTMINLSLNHTGQYALVIGNGRGHAALCNFNLVVKVVVLQLDSKASQSVEFARINTIYVSILADPPPFSYSLIKDDILEKDDAYAVKYAPEAMHKGTVTLTAVDWFEYGVYDFVIKNRLGDELVYSFKIIGDALTGSDGVIPIKGLVFIVLPVVLLFFALFVFVWKKQEKKDKPRPFKGLTTNESPTESDESTADTISGSSADSNSETMFSSDGSSMDSLTDSEISGEVESTSVDHLPRISQSKERDSVLTKDRLGSAGSKGNDKKGIEIAPSIYEIESYPEEIRSISSDENENPV